MKMCCYLAEFIALYRYTDSTQWGATPWTFLQPASQPFYYWLCLPSWIFIVEEAKPSIPTLPGSLWNSRLKARPAPNKRAMSLAKSWSKPNALKTFPFCSNAKSSGRKRIQRATIPSKWKDRMAPNNVRPKALACARVDTARDPKISSVSQIITSNAESPPSTQINSTKNNCFSSPSALSNREPVGIFFAHFHNWYRNTTSCFPLAPFNRKTIAKKQFFS